MSALKNSKRYEPSNRNMLGITTRILRNKGTRNPSLSRQMPCAEDRCLWVSQHTHFLYDATHLQVERGL